MNSKETEVTADRSKGGKKKMKFWCKLSASVKATRHRWMTSYYLYDNFNQKTWLAHTCTIRMIVPSHEPGRWQIGGARCAGRHGRRCSRSVVGRPRRSSKIIDRPERSKKSKSSKRSKKMRSCGDMRSIVKFCNVLVFLQRITKKIIVAFSYSVSLSVSVGVDQSSRPHGCTTLRRHASSGCHATCGRTTSQQEVAPHAMPYPKNLCIEFHK